MLREIRPGQDRKRFGAMTVEFAFVAIILGILVSGICRYGNPLLEQAAPNLVKLLRTSMIEIEPCPKLINYLSLLENQQQTG